MNLINLTVEEMVFVSSSWMAAGPVRELILKTPEVAGLLPRLGGAHTALLTLQPGDDPKLGELSQAVADTDGVHDNLVRGIFHVLTGMAYLEANGQDFLELREQLLPEGLDHTQKSYQSESGYTSLVEKRLSPEARRQLTEATVNGRALLDHVQAWLEAGAKVGSIETERASRINPTPPTRAQTHAARLAWLRLANAFAAGVEIAELAEAPRQQLLGPLEQASAAAEQRAARRRPGPLTSTIIPAANATTATSATSSTTEGKERSA